MTTANLSVGINTDKAKLALRELKAWMAKDMSVKVGIDPASIDQSIHAYFKQRTFKVKVNTKDLAAEVGNDLEIAINKKFQKSDRTLGWNHSAFAGSLNSALKAAFDNRERKVQFNRAGLESEATASIAAALGKMHRVHIDQTHLASQVKVAVEQGMVGAKFSPGGVPAASSSALPVGAIQAAIAQSLNPAMEEIGKAAAILAGTVRKIGDRETSSKSRAKVGYSGKRGDGSTISESTPLPDADAARAEIMALNAAKVTGELGAQSSRETLRARRSFRRASETEAQRAAADEQQDSNRTFAARRSFRRASETEAQRAAADEQRDSNRTFAARRSFRRANEADVQRAATEEQRDSNRTLAARRAFRRAQAQQEQAGIALAYTNAKDDARGSFTGRGVNISAARSIADQFGAKQARDFLGRDAGLLDRGNELESYRRKVKAVGETLKNAAANTAPFKGALSEMHAGARGLAGSLGALWLTWGSIAPLAAGAAIGAMLRSVVTVGKDVEYQLRFVSVLSDGAAISTQRFTDALQGSLVAPAEAAQALRGLAQNGLNAQESLQALPAILQLATAGEMSLSDAALGATGVMAAFNLQVTDLGRIGDVFAKAAASSNTSVAAMVESMKQASTVSDQYHVSLEETAASLAVLAKRNITGTAAGTAFRNMMVEVATPTVKAKAMMAQLGIQLYDTSGQLKSYAEVLSILKERTVGLNEKGKLTFLSKVFNERGEKAVNALLSDYQLYGRTLDEIKNKSKDFASSVTEALSETTVGKLKGLMSEFQQATLTAFEEGKNGVNNFVDALRVLVSSDEFKSGLRGLVAGVLELTTFLRENAKMILITAGAWASLNVINSVVTGFIALRGALVAAGVAAAGARVAMLGLMSAATGGLSLVVALVVEFFLFRTRTDDATEAQKALNNQLDSNNKTMEANLRNLREENALTARKNELMRQGNSAAAAAAIVEKEGFKASNQTLQEKVNAAQSKLDAAEAGNARYEAWRWSARKAGERAPEGMERTSPELIAAYRDTLTKAQTAKDLFTESSTAKQIKADEGEAGRRLGIFKAFNDRLYEIKSTAAGKKLNLQGLFVVGGETGGSAEQFNEMMRKRNEDLNKRLPSISTPNPELRTDELSQSRALLAKLNLEQSVAQQRIKLRKQLDEATFPASLYGPSAAASLTAIRNIEEENDSITVQVRLLESLKLARNAANLTAPDRRDLQSAIDKESAQIDQRKAALKVQREVAVLDAQERLRQDNESNKSSLTGLSIDDKKQLDKLRASYSSKVKSPEDAAESSARAEVDARYAEKIAQQQQIKITLEERLTSIKDSTAHMTLEELATVSAMTSVLESNLALESSRLVIMNAQASAAAQLAGKVGRTEEERSQEAGYGWDKFWNEYRSSAESNAKIVYDTMKTTTSGMQDMFSTFVQTGKLDFKSLVRTIIAEAARALAAKAVIGLLKLGASLLTGGGNTTGTGVNPMNGSTNFANGGVMTSGGSLALRKYASGGVARGPQLALYGEGRQPEAYVPLPDGRSIPVTMQGGGGGGNVNATVNVHIDSQGGSKVESDASGKKAQQLGAIVQGAVTEAIVREKRPGGLLYSN